VILTSSLESSTFNIKNIAVANKIAQVRYWQDASILTGSTATWVLSLPALSFPWATVLKGE
jgi:hypothetical protein